MNFLSTNFLYGKKYFPISKDKGNKKIGVDKRVKT